MERARTLEVNFAITITVCLPDHLFDLLISQVFPCVDMALAVLDHKDS